MLAGPGRGSNGWSRAANAFWIREDTEFLAAYRAVTIVLQSGRQTITTLKHRRRLSVGLCCSTQSPVQAQRCTRTRTTIKQLAPDHRKRSPVRDILGGERFCVLRKDAKCRG